MMMPPSPSSTPPDRQTSGKVRLHNAIIFPLILQMLGAIGLVGWLALRSNDTVVQNLAQKLRNEIIEHVHDRISTYIAAPHLVNETNRIALDLGMLTWDNPSQAETYFRRQALSQPSIGYVGFANENAQYLRVGWVNRLADQPQLETAVQLTPGGGTLAYYGLNPNSGQREAIPSQTIPNYDVRLRPFYTIAQQEDRPAWSQIYTNVAYPLLQINASTPYYDRDGEFQGILTTQLGLNQIGAFLEFVQSFKSGTLYILERDGNLVATSLKTVPLLTRANPNDPTLPFDRIPARNSASPLIQSSVTFLETQFGQLAAIQSSHQLDFIFNEERHFLQVSPFQDPYGIDWLIVAVFPESDFIAEVRGNQQTMVLLGIGIFLILGSTSFLTTRLLTQPLRTLVTTTETAATAIATESTTESTTDNIATITQELTSPSHTAAITNNSRDTVPSDQNTRPNPHQNPDHPSPHQPSHHPTDPPIPPTSFIYEIDRLHHNFKRLIQQQRPIQQQGSTQPASPPHHTSDSPTTPSDRLLSSLLPPHLIQQLQDNNQPPAAAFREVSLLFLDLVRLTTLSDTLPPLQLVQDINAIFASFDTLVAQHGLEKIQTLGDAYLVVSGLSQPRADHAAAIADLALALQTALAQHPLGRAQQLQVRIGINTGPVIIGSTGPQHFIYDLWGDTVTIAANIEAQGTAGCIQVTATTATHLQNQYNLESRPPLRLQGRPPLPTYWLRSKRLPPETQE